MTMEIHHIHDYEAMCPCGNKMTLIFYLSSPDTRALEIDTTAETLKQTQLDFGTNLE